MSKLQLPQVLDALESCGIKTEYFYGKPNEIRDSYYVKDGKYYHSYPDNKSRKIIEDEVETEEKFIYELLCGAKTYISGLSNHPSGLIDILSALCKENNENDIATCHRALFGKETPFWTFNIITQKDQLFNKDFNCGIGFIDGKYIVEYQLPAASGDHPRGWYYDLECDNFYDACKCLKECLEDYYSRCLCLL